MKKQSFLTAVIIILVIALITIIGSIVYEEMINMKKQVVQNTQVIVEQEVENDTIIDEIEEEVITEDESEEEEITENEIEEKTDENEEVFEEESNTEDVAKSIDEKVIDLVKKECGNDESVSFSIERKKGTKYYVAVKSNDVENIWYEVDTETWEVSEY